MAAMAAGRANENILNSAMPRSFAMPTTKKLVEVPMVVAMPPTKVAKPIGIRILVGDLLVRRQTDMRIGSNSTTIGVLLIKAESRAPTTKVMSNDNAGIRPHNCPKTRPTGSNAPVLTKPWPSVIRAQTAISASWAKPRKNIIGSTSG